MLVFQSKHLNLRNEKVTRLYSRSGVHTTEYCLILHGSYPPQQYQASSQHPLSPPLLFYLYSRSRKRALETLVSETGEGAFLIGVGLDVGSRLLLTTAGLLDYLRIREVRLAYLILP